MSTAPSRVPVVTAPTQPVLRTGIENGRPIPKNKHASGRRHDRGARFVLSTALREAGYTVEGYENAGDALDALHTRSLPDLIFTDVRMPGDDGLALLEKLKTAHPQLPVIVMSAYTDIASTAGAFRGGAHEFLSKPFDLDHAVALAARALPEPDVRALRADSNTMDAIRAHATTATDRGNLLLGDTPAMRALFRSIGRLAQAPLSVLVTGETGTGKELVARALHRESPRASRPFIALNTSAIPSELLESELFGHEAGAFTGASKRHVGRFEQADGGTLFLDEIGDMPLPLQTRLLRVLAEGEFFRVGGRALVRVDVRVIAATHQPLETLVADGRFRADLLHRIDVVRLRLPPLRERRDDVPILANRFLAAPQARSARPQAFSRGRHRRRSCMPGPATCVNWRTCAGGWRRWRRAKPSALPTWTMPSRPLHRRPSTTGTMRWRPGRARAWRKAMPASMRRRASVSIVPCSKLHWPTPAAIVAKRPRNSGWDATP